MAKPASGSTLNTGHALAASLVGCWPMLEGSGSTAADLTANARTLTLNTATWTTENSDACLTNSTSASDNVCSLASTLTLPGNQSWTIAWRSKMTSANSNGIVCGEAGNATDYLFTNSAAGNVAMRFKDSNNNEGIITHATNYTTLRDYACVYDHGAQTLTAYFNGVSQGSVSFTAGANIDINRVMAGYNTGTPSLGYVGTFHYIYIWDNRALSSTELGDLSTDPWVFLDAPVSDSVTVTCPRILQRDPSSASLALSGAYVGATASKVQVKLFLDADDSTVTDWTDVDTSLSGGTWSGSLTVSTGGPYYVQSRLLDGSSNVLATSSSSGNIICGDVFVVMGQSSAAGYGTSNQSYTGSSVAWVVRESGTIDEAINDPVSDNGTGGSWATLLATLISAQVGSSVPIAIVSASNGGIALFGGQWLPPSGTQWVIADNLIDGLSLNSIKSVMWLQGESDVANSVSQANYTTAEQTFAAAVAAWPGAPDVISILTGQQSTRTDAAIDAIRKAKIANWGTGHTLPGAVPIDIDLVDGGGDGLHYKTNAELAEMAGRIWLALKSAVYSGSTGRGPIASSAGFEADTVRVVFDKALDTGDTTYTSSAWSVTSNGSPATISSVTRNGSTAVDIVCSASLTAPVTVTYGSGNTPAGATVPKTSAQSIGATINSISSVTLPAEPIYAMAAGAGLPAIGGSAANLLLMGVG